MLAQCGGVVSAYPAALVHNISVRGSYCPLPTTHRSNTADQEDGGRALRRHLQEVQRRTNCSDSQGPIVFINCDIWQSKVTGEKFIGESALSLAKSSVAF